MGEFPESLSLGGWGQGQELDKQIKGEWSWACRAGWHIMRWVTTHGLCGGGGQRD